MLFQIQILAVLAACAAAQKFTVAEFFNVSNVDASTRSSWCNFQFDICPVLCGGSTSMNKCISETLEFNCTCAGNNSAPGLAFYQNTLPSNECVFATATCVNDHPNNLTGIDQCNTDINSTCGALDSSKGTFNSTPISTTTTSAPSTSATVASTGSVTSAAPSSSATAKSAAAVVISVGQRYSLGALAAGAIAAFGFFL